MTEDLAMEIGEVRRNLLTDEKGVPYPEFRRSLKPRWGVVWAELLAGHAVIGLLASVLALAPQLGWVVGVLSVPVCAIGLGFCFHYLYLFLHEAAHYNLAPDRRWNDRLANALIGLVIGQDVRVYRPLHFDHHRHLGTPADPEHVYFEPLSLRTILEALTGIRLLKVIAVRLRHRRDSGEGGFVTPTLLASACANGVGIALAALGGHFALALGWGLGLGLFLPFFGFLRPLLEHRSETADPAVDYTREPHGEVNRLFGDGPLARTLGGAGFNRHLLHHWEPQLSFTQLKGLERYLEGTELAAFLRRHRTTYLETFGHLYRAA